MQAPDSLVDPSFIDRVAADSGIDPTIVTQRWATGPSLIADLVSENALATPGWPDPEHLTGQPPRTVIAALLASLENQLADEQLTRTALAHAIGTPAVRTLWSEFVHDDLAHWAEILRHSLPTQPTSVDTRDQATIAVTIVAGQYYSRLLLGTAATHVSDDESSTSPSPCSAEKPKS